MSKILQTAEQAMGLKDPNFPPDGDSKQPIEDKDFTDKTNDISKKAKATLGAYLSDKTSKNSYPVSSKSATAVANARGTALSQADNNNQITFSNAEDLAPFSELSFFNDISTIVTDISGSGLSGDTLLKEIPKGGASPITKIASPISNPIVGEGRGYNLLKLIHEQLKTDNMYSPDGTVPDENKPETDRRPFLKNVGSKNEQEQIRGLFSIQRDLGHFHVDGKRVDVAEMSSMAMAMLMRSVGNDGAAQAILEGDLNKIGILSVLGIVTRPAQIGAKGLGIDNYRFSSLRNFSGPIAEKAKSATGQDSFIINIASEEGLLNRGTPPNNSNLPNLQSSPRNAGSYAQMNTFMEPFSVGTRFSSTGMFTMALAATLAMLGLAYIAYLIGKLGSDTAPLNKPNNPSVLVFGKHKTDGALTTSLTKLFQITRTDHNFSDAVGHGIAQLFGLFDNSTSTVAAISSPESALVIAENLILTGGFYANFTRRLISSAANVASVFAKIGPNVSGGIESVLKGIENLLDSAAYKFIMIAAGVGDASLKSRFGMMDVNSNERILPYRISETKNPYDLGMIDVGSKLKGGGELGVYRNQLYRWGSDKNRSTNSLSLKTFLAAQKYPETIISTGNNRSIRPSADMVQHIENALESEYMPFYIHDLRTHEIMSMPAFITEFGETFTPNYNSVEGIGRQDPVRLYSKTERAVTFGFMLVSFSEEDHDHMWWTINKLIAMCYPQYSKGRVRQTENDANGNAVQFIQPFSQVQAASPMVRLRLGDVFKSNYSKFGLARLFGANKDVNLIKNDKAQTDYKKALQAQTISLVNAKTKIIEQFNDILGATDKSFGVLATKFPKGAEVILGDVGQAFTPDGNPIKGVSIKDGTIATLEEAIPWKKGKGLKEILPGFNVKLKDSPEVGLVSYIGIGHIKKLTDDWVNQRANEDEAVRAAAKNVEKFKPADKSNFDNDFFTSERNAIIRSFESARGRGVAGFITSLTLDYGMGNHVWETKPGSRAPTVVKISMGFSPITDLPLGLDYYGEIRNPSHPVGNFAGNMGDVHESMNSETTLSVKPPSNYEVVNNIKAKSKADEAEKDIAKAFTLKKNEGKEEQTSNIQQDPATA